MMALSIRQPWAWLIIAGYKPVENRDWPTAQRGDRLIHTGKEMDREAHLDLMRGIHPATGEKTKLNLVYPPALGHELELGGIVGMVEITDCVTFHDSEWFMGKFGFVLRNPRPLPYQPCPGKLGFFRPDRTIDIRPVTRDAGQGRLL